MRCRGHFTRKSRHIAGEIEIRARFEPDDPLGFRGTLRRVQRPAVTLSPDLARLMNVFSAATKLRHAVAAERKLLTSQRKLQLSLQSIMGAMQRRRSNPFMSNIFLVSVGPVKRIANSVGVSVLG